MAEQVTLHTDNRVVAAHERLAEVIEAPVLVERDARPSVGEADMSGGERDAEAGTPEDGADLFFCPPHTEPCQYHAHTDGHAWGGLLLSKPGQHPSMPQAAANPSARRGITLLKALADAGAHLRGVSPYIALLLDP
jgi:hypothetical protein